MQDVVAIFGGVYNNHRALSAVVEEAERLGATRFYCLGDLGGFGPNPDKSIERIRDDSRIHTMMGNYDDSIGRKLDDCQCGYTDPRDNHYAKLSYDYTLANTSDKHSEWLRSLPTEFRMGWAGRAVLMAHGSPRYINEFLWESTSPDAFLQRVLRDADADILFVTHTGIPWKRTLSDGRMVVNVGAIGRPANDGDLRVDLTLARFDDSQLEVEQHKVAYDYEATADEMRLENLPEPFVETILTGWWTTCLEILPARERAIGKY